MASTADAAAGWEIYREADYALTLDEINATLQRRGHAPVSLRTYRHYGKLQRYGYQRYVPINQLDVKTLLDPFIDQARRGREHPIQTLTQAELRVLVDDQIRSFAGTAIELGSTEVVVRLTGEEMADFFSKLGLVAREPEGRPRQRPRPSPTTRKGPLNWANAQLGGGGRI